MCKLFWKVGKVPAGIRRENMAHKVVICGINTSALPKLTGKEALSLMRKVKEGDELARQKFITSNLRLVLSVVQRYAGKAGCSMDDLFQVGCVGLVKSVDNFDVSLNVKFSTYAVPMIIGEIRRFLRESNSMRVSRGIRDVAYLALQARERLERESMGEEVTLEQIAKEINLPVGQVVYCLDAINEPLSLNEPVYNDGSDTILVMDQIKDKNNTDERWIENVSLNDAIARLDERERDILTKRYFEGKTQMEVSEEVGISQAQVSRLEKNAVGRMRSFL